MLHSIIAGGLMLAASIPAQAHYLRTSESDCSPIDLRNEFQIKMRDQRDISWCYAHAASDYLQFVYRLSEQISAADIAILYAGSDTSRILTFFRRIFSSGARKEPPQTGFIGKAIRRAIPEGYCPESALPSETWTRVDSRSGSREQVGIMGAILEVYSLRSQVLAGRIRSSMDFPSSYEFKHLNREEFADLVLNTPKNKILSALRARACAGERKPYPHADFSTDFHFTGRKVFRRINQTLGDHAPMAIDFFSGIFDDYSHYKRKLDDLHTVLLYGRKFDPGTQECVYLMKNSYGEDCSRYDPRIQCERGYLWFPENRLYPTLTSVLSMDRE